MPMTELGPDTGGLGAGCGLFSFTGSDYIMEWATGKPGEDTQQQISFALFLMSSHFPISPGMRAQRSHTVLWKHP